MTLNLFLHFFSKKWRILAPFLLLAASTIVSHGGEKLLIQLSDFTQSEVKSGGFTIPSDSKIHITALGSAAGKKNLFQSGDMYAYGWIINADTREMVWMMERNNTIADKKFRKFDDQVFLKRGSYEVYFTAYAYGSGAFLSNFSTNIDRRNLSSEKDNKRGFLNWLENVFGGEAKKDWKKLAKDWGISLYIDDKTTDVNTFSTPKEFSNILFKKTHAGEDVRIKQRFKLSNKMSIGIYALGERDFNDNLADYGWVVDLKTHKRIWEMRRDNVEHAGGASKNVKFDDVVNFPAGDYMLYYYTDGSHSYLDWNDAPPFDPYNYGITLTLKDEGNKPDFKLIEKSTEEKNIIVQLTRMGDDETRNVGFTLKAEAAVRIYAIGERANSRKQMADFGWIINSKTREKIWTMDADRTDRAGGSDKNRMIDEVITLPAGSYRVFYQTDDSHSYSDWNDDPPDEPDHYGITIYGEGEDFNSKIVDLDAKSQNEGIIAQIIHVKNDANKTQNFYLDRQTTVRIYALGEGQNREMYDYGWIENAGTGEVVWEMTYSMTFHAGGGRKNRSVSATLILEKGNYILHYVSDDSHSYNDWNTDPPDDPTMWGITLYRED